MGVFAERDLSKANATSGGNYFTEPGQYECLIVGWKSFLTKDKEQALIADFKILSGDDAGAIRNFYLGEKNIMFDQKVKNLLVAAAGLSDGLDADKVAKEDWYKVLETSVKPPSMMLNRKIRVSVTRDIKGDGKKKLKKNPALADDPEFEKDYGYTKVEFSFHDDTRKDVLKLAK